MLRERLMGPRGPAMRVELDKKALFALASDTRLDILKSLQPMRRTVTQLADTIGIDKAAIHRHLKTLEDGGFVKRYEDHGFVYYGLSWKARDLLSPTDNTRIVVMVALTVFLSAIAVVALLAVAVSDDALPFGEAFSPRSDQMSADTDQEMAVGNPIWMLLIMLISVVMSVLLAILTFRLARRPRQPESTQGAHS